MIERTRTKHYIILTVALMVVVLIFYFIGSHSKLIYQSIIRTMIAEASTLNVSTVSDETIEFYNNLNFNDQNSTDSASRQVLFTPMSFTTATTDEYGVIRRIPGTPVPRYYEDLSNGVNIEMILVQSGNFSMGAPVTEWGSWDDERPQRQVTMKEFVMGKYEITQVQWRAVMGTNPSYFKGDNLPVEQVSWNDAQIFCRRLNEKLGLSDTSGYRLPSSAEWEYAARAGTITPYSFGITLNPEIVNYNSAQSSYGKEPIGVFRGKTVDVGSLGVGNQWGFFDMYGNVWEWCEDDYHNNYEGAPKDGQAWVNPGRSEWRVLRGCSWPNWPIFCRSARNARDEPNLRAYAIGFRIARTLPAENLSPTIQNVVPSEALMRGSGFNLTVNGQNFVNGAVVKWNGASRPTTYVSSTKLTAIIDSSDLTTSGTALVTVFNPLPGGGTSGTVSFTILAPNPLPQLTSILPAIIIQGGARFTLTISGRDFVDGAIVRWNGQNKSTSYVSTTQLTAQITEADIASAGMVNVSVFNPAPGGGVSNSLSIAIGSLNPVPTITSIAPGIVQAGGGNYVLAVNGTNFISTTKVEINGSERVTSYVSPTQLTLTLMTSDTQSPGLLQVSVKTPAPGGGTSASIPLTVAGQTPAASSLSPSMAIAGSGGFTLTITGNNFTPGSSVLINGSSRMTTFISPTLIAVMISSIDIATAGTLTIAVVNPFAPNSNVIELPIYNRVTSVSAASYAAGEQAPDSLIAAFGVGLATGVEINTASTLPTQLRGTKLVVKDSTGTTRVQSLFFVAPGQINYHLHPATALGMATITVYVDNRIVSVGELNVGRLAPAIFTQNSTGDGVPAAYGLRVKGSSVTAVSILSYDNTLPKWIPEAIDLGPDGQNPDVVYLVLFGTGLRSNTGATSTMVKFNSTNAVPVYAGEAPGYVGLDQMNVVIPRSLIGAGLVNLEVIVDGKVANQSKVIQIRIK